MDIVNTYLWTAVQETLSSITSTKDFLDEAERTLQDLKDNYVLVDQELVANRHGMQLTPQVQRWHGKVQLPERQDIVNQLKVAYNNRGYLLGSCSFNLRANYKISQSSIKLYKDINNLKMEHNAFKEIVEAQPPKAVLGITTSVTLVGNAIKLNLEKIHGYLVDDNVSTVGIWGMGGVGKTTLLNEINNSFLGGDTNPGFKYVISLVVSKEPQLEKLQNEISKRLGLPFDSGKSDIFEFLKKKDFLLLLDDIWKGVDLPKALGIPLPLHQSQNYENRDQRYKRKVIFTTRDDEVCAHMNPHKKIRVECLDGEEAWHLFKQFSNEEIINSNVVIKKLAREVMERCSGLPLALKVIGRATSNMKKPAQWRHMLDLLIKVDVRTIAGIEESLFSKLKVSYDMLASDTLRQCFLCCAQWREDMSIPVSALIEHWIGCELISDFENIGKAFDEGHFIIEKLNEACLLEVDFGVGMFNEEDYVKLHDVIRDMALWIVSEGGKKKNKWIVCGSDDDSRQFPKWEAGNWQETELISFNGNFSNKSLQKFFSDQNIDENGQLSVVVTSPRYPNLHCLFMQQLELDLGPKVVVNIFPHMPSLTHLNLSWTPIKVLPKEIRVLVNLRYLNISFTKIKSLPSELKELAELKYFLFCNRSFCSSSGGRRVDGLATISMLPKLQVLDLFDNTCLKASDLRLLMDRNIIKAISLNVHSVKIFGLLKHLPTWKILLFDIKNMHTLQLCDLSNKHGEGLMELDIKRSSIEELLINGSVVNIKQLFLFHLEKLKQITWPAETLPSKCFSRLTSITIICCYSLRSLSWVLHLPCLIRLDIRGCSAMEELIDPADQMQQASSGLPTFPSLQSLTILHMENLVSLSTCPLDFPVLSELWLKGCPKLKKLPFKSSIVNNKFQFLKTDKNLRESLEWKDKTI